MDALEFKIIRQIADITQDFTKKFVAMDLHSSLMVSDFDSRTGYSYRQPLVPYQQRAASIEGSDPNKVVFGYLDSAHHRHWHIFSLLVLRNWVGAGTALTLDDETVLPKNEPPLAIRLPTENELTGILGAIRRGADISSSPMFAKPKHGGAMIAQQQLAAFRPQA